MGLYGVESGSCAASDAIQTVSLIIFGNLKLFEVAKERCFRVLVVTVKTWHI